MSETKNHVELIGYVKGRPVVVPSGRGDVIANFKVLTLTEWNGGGDQWRAKVESHAVVAFNGLARLVERVVTDGCLIRVEARLETRVRTDRESGRQIEYVQITANRIYVHEGISGPSRATWGHAEGFASKVLGADA